MCISTSDFVVVEEPVPGLQILEPVAFTPVNYIAATLFVVFTAVCIFGLLSIFLGFYKAFFSKDKTLKSKGKKQLKWGLIIFCSTFGMWVIINLLTAFLRVCK